MVSSIVCVKRSGSEFRDAWVASGKQVCILFYSVNFRTRMSYSFLLDLSLSTGYTKSDTNL